MTLEDKVRGRAEQLSNVSRACREAGVSRALFYRWRQRLERYGQERVYTIPGRDVLG